MCSYIFSNQITCEYLRSRCSLHINEKLLPVVKEAKSLGLVIDPSFRYRQQVSKYIQRAYCNLKMLYQHKTYLPRDVKLLLCNSLVLSSFTYCSAVYGPSIDVNDHKRIQRVQNACLRYVFNIRKYDHITHTLDYCNWLNMRNRFLLRAACMYHSIITTKIPCYLYEKISFRTDVHNINVRSRGLITPPFHKTALFERSFSFNVYKVYNAIPCTIKMMPLTRFKKSLFCYIYERQVANLPFP